LNLYTFSYKILWHLTSYKTNQVKFYCTDEHAKIAQIGLHLSSQYTAVKESAFRL